MSWMLLLLFDGDGEGAVVDVGLGVIESIQLYSAGAARTQLYSPGAATSQNYAAGAQSVQVGE